MRIIRQWFPVIAWLFVLAGCPQFCAGYSVLTHEQVVDLVWKDNIVPLLKERFPDASDVELNEAHAYAYGGSVVQDMGYYPFGNELFSNLTHYVRTGDFVANLIMESSNLNEYAFALGALAHYSSDNCGHPTINQVTAIEFPNLERKFGPEVTYDDNPKAHIRTEFGFDMVQVAKNRYTSDRYHDFIGFEVSKPVLERAFVDTYNIPLNSVIKNEDLAIGTFRRAVSKIIPEMTRVALLERRKEIVAETPNFNKKRFRYYLSRTNYQKEWGKGYRKPGFGARVLATLLKIVPKVGPFKALAFKIPTQKSEDLYIASVDRTVQNYKQLLANVREKQLRLANLDFDTGRSTRRGEYPLADKTYAQLLDRLTERDFGEITLSLQANILKFYSEPATAVNGKRQQERLQKTESELDKLKSATVPAIKTGE